jgi:predicted RNA-binding protein with TRAM domain
MPIRDLKAQPVKPGEEVVVDVDDIHESGAGVGRTDDGFIILVDGLLPEARATVKIHRVKSNHATAKEVVERLPMDDEEGEEGEEGETNGEPSGERNDSRQSRRGRDGRERLGSREDFWGG